MRRDALPRVLLGALISVVFLALVISRVDLPAVGAALGHANPALMAAALGVLVVDLLLRAFRWRVLLAALVPSPPSLRGAAAYLTIGFMANAVLPARLGDVARAYLAGAAFGTARLATLGTVLIERVSDGLMMVLLAALSSVLVVSGVAAELRDLQVAAILLVIAGFVGLGVLLVALRSGPLARTRPGMLAAALVGRLGTGAAALRTPRGAATVVGATAAAALSATVIWALVLAAVGLTLSPQQVLLVCSGTALSLAIPAAPSSLGTFEYVGVLILTSFGATAEVALAAIVLFRLSTTIPMALVGLVVMWATHLRPGALVEAADGQPAGSARA